MPKNFPRPLWGQKICDRRGWSFGEVFRHQFRIGRARAVPEWEGKQIGPFWLEHCPFLPVTPILSDKGKSLGYLLGIAVDAEGAGFGYDGGPPVTLAARFDAVAQLQARLAGRFAIVVEIDGETRFYPDASSSLTAVMNARTGVLAASVPLAIDTPLRVSPGRKVDELWRVTRLQLMGETADRRVTQLFANHYIDLADCSAHRFWPDRDTPFDTPGPDAIPRLAKRLQGIMTSLTHRFDCALPVTGGQDSRLLAAALTPDSAVLMAHYFVYEINWATGFDVAAAKPVADHIGVPLKVLRLMGEPQGDAFEGFDPRLVRAQIALATGFSQSRLTKPVLQAMQATPPSQVVLRGGAAELVHANKWPQPARIPDVVTAEFAFERLALQSPANLRAALGEEAFDASWLRYTAWFAALPEAARRRAPDVGHRELWLSGPFGTIFQAPRRHFYLNPFNDHQLMAETTRFDPKMRRSGALLKALLDHLSPGLSELPYATQLRAKAQAA